MAPAGQVAGGVLRRGQTVVALPTGVTSTIERIEQGGREIDAAFAPMFARVMSEKGFTFGTPQILPVHHLLPPTAHSTS